MGLLEAVEVVKKLGRGSSGATIGPVSLRVEPGTVTALVGRSGSGKSTVLNSVAGLMRPSAGRVIFDGDDIARASDQRLARLRREAFGFVFQDYTLLDPLTGQENIELPARNHWCNASGWKVAWRSPRIDSRAVSVSGWPSHGRWPTVHECSSPTSPPERWTP